MPRDRLAGIDPAALAGDIRPFLEDPRDAHLLTGENLPALPGRERPA